MNRFLLWFGLLVGSAAIVVYACMWGNEEYQWFDWRMGEAFVCLWPAALMAKWGLSHGWIILLAGALIVAGCAAWRLRNKHWMLAPALGGAVAVGYCLAAQPVFRGLHPPVPAVTPYDANAVKRAEYLTEYREGYREGLSGVTRTYCFAPEHTTRGFYQGMSDGRLCFNLMLGRTELSEREKYLIRAWAGTDGVLLDPTNTVPGQKQ